MGVLGLILPVYGRPGITRVCLEQKAHLVAELAARGVEAHVVVTGDDENLDTARELGFHILERPNVLARKLNDAFEYAVRELGADHVSFVGSDDWLLPEFMADFPEPDQVRTSKWVTFVAPTGDHLLTIEYQGAVGNASWIIPAPLLEPCGYRPFQPETKRSGMDGMLVQSITPRPPDDRRARIEWYKARGGKQRHLFAHAEADPMRMVDFKGTREQITGWSLIVGRRSRIRYESDDPWATLATRYPADLVERMERVYAEGRA